MEVDPRFKAAKETAAKRRKRKGLPWGWIAVGLTVPSAIGGIAYLIFSGFISFGPPPDIAATEDIAEEDITEAAYVSPFIDVAGDPLFLKVEGTVGENTQYFAPPLGLTPGRAVGDVALISDTMISRDARLITTLPTSREDFAFFQSQRSVPTEPVNAANLGTPASTSLRVLPDPARLPATTDLVIRLTEDRPISEVLAETRFVGAEADAFAAALTEVAPSQTLTAGTIVATRYLAEAGRRTPLQMTVYDEAGYLGSIAREDAGGAVPNAADAWIDVDLVGMADRATSRQTAASSGAAQQFRLLDAIYSTALRNGMSSALVGEAVVLLSKAFDVDAFAQPGDRLTLLFAPQADLTFQGGPQILYAAIERPAGALRCYVTRQASQPDFKCFGGNVSAGSAAPSLRAGMTAPVSGVLRVPFGPWRNPATQKVEVHEGIDWAAPMNTVVRAALDGEVREIREDTEFGTTLTLTHADGKSSFYGHLSATAQLAPGASVTAGQTIGYVGTSGQTNVPHLHFGLFDNGKAVDPFVHGGGGLAGEAVEQLVNQIIQVESGGRTDAANPNSTAVGPGQFIKSTWIRMMKTYRPDLVASLDREELLKLRTDYTLSYEMVTNLAREGEAFLTARGHQVTAGRLYLAHFLGAKGADEVLSASDEDPLVDVVGQGVIKANKFLTGKSVKDIEDWADRKMRGRSKARKVAVLPPEVQAYKTMIDGLLTGG